MLHLDKLSKDKKKAEISVNEYYANQFEKNQTVLKEIYNKKRMLAEFDLMKDKKEQKAVLKKARENDAFFETVEIERTAFIDKIKNASSLQELEEILAIFENGKETANG